MDTERGRQRGKELSIETEKENKRKLNTKTMRDKEMIEN